MTLLGWAALGGSSAGAEPVAGAEYTGTAARGGAVAFTVAADGDRVTSYRISDVPGDTCVFLAEGDAGDWEGAPILAGVFDYALHDAIALRGGFPGPQSASGTFRLFNRAVPGVKPACDTGTVAWTARTTSAPRPADSSAPASATGSAPAAGTAIRTSRTSVLLRRRGAATLTGRIVSASRGCVARRRVTLKRAARTIASTLSRADGTFRFARSRSVRGHRVRATVSARRSVPRCAAASSKSLRA